LIQGHKVKMLDIFFIVQPHATPELRLRDDFSHVLEYELMRSQIGLGTEAVPLLFRLNDRDICPFLSLESLVLAFRATATVSDALNLRSAVDTVRVLPAGHIFGDSRLWEP